MKSTNLYSGLAIILAAAANTAVVGCAGVDDREDAIDTESSVQSVSSPCHDAQNGSEATPEQPAQNPADMPNQGSPCSRGAEAPSNYGAQQGNDNAPMGNDVGPQGDVYGGDQGPQGGDMAPPATYYNRSVTIQTVGVPSGGGYGGYGAGMGGYGGYGAGVGGYGGGVGGYGGGCGVGGCGGYGLGLGIGGYGLGFGGYGLGFRRGWW